MTMPGLPGFSLAAMRRKFVDTSQLNEQLGDIDYDLRTARTEHAIVWSKAMAAGLADVYPALSPGLGEATADWARCYIWAINCHLGNPVFVYVNGYRMEEFFVHVLPSLIRPIVIVSGDSIWSVFSEALPEKFLKAGFPRDWRVVAVIAQNLDLVHRRAFPVPVGLDFHSIHRGTVKTWGMEKGQTPQSQEDELLGCRDAAAPWIQRSPVVYVQFNIESNIDDRMQCQVACERLRAARIERFQVPRGPLWQAMARCRFVASPPGGGHDCHRTWEALALGCVPIVMRNPAMSPLFADLPVWEVDHYCEVTDDTLAEKSREFETRLTEGAYDWSKLTVPWWRKHLRNAVAARGSRWMRLGT